MEPCGESTIEPTAPDRCKPVAVPRRIVYVMLGKPSYITIGMLSVALLAVAACSGGGEDSSSGSGDTTGPQLIATVLSTDLSKGVNRVVFVLRETNVIISEPEVDVSIHYEGARDASDTGVGRFQPWPIGGLGVYSARLEFDREGPWDLRVAVAGPDGSTRTARALFEVAERGVTPAIGAAAPLSETKTVGDVQALEELTTARPPNPELYSMSIAEAVTSGKPLVVVFATPLYCETFTCGPQLEVIEGIKDRYEGRTNFIHVEIFDEPHLIQGDPDSARSAPAVAEWGLRTEPWTFIVDSEGRIAAKFEAFTTAREIEEALERVL